LRLFSFLLSYKGSQLTFNLSSLMEFSFTAEDMHAARPPYDIDEASDWGGNDMSEFENDTQDDGEPRCNDLSDDADALASAGFGTDEDYGCYGGEDDHLDGYYESLTECDFGE